LILGKVSIFSQHFFWFSSLGLEFRQEPELISTGEEDILPVKVGSLEYYKYVPREFRGQCLSQCIVCGTQFCLLRIHSVTEVLITILIYAEPTHTSKYLSAIDAAVGNLLKPFHKLEDKLDVSALSKLVDKKDLEVACSHYPLWAGYRRYIKSNGLFVNGVHNFKTGVQHLYNKTKQGLDGNTYFTCAVESADLKTTWEQKIVLHGLDQVSNFNRDETAFIVYYTCLSGYGKCICWLPYISGHAIFGGTRSGVSWYEEVQETSK